jgi:hypothetical protein
MDITALQTDKALKNEGIWVEYADARFLIRSYDSPAYRRAMLKAAKPERNAIGKDPEAAIRAATKAMAEAIILDWEGVEENGQPLPCTPENKLRLMEIQELREFIAAESQDAANFRREGLAADAADLKSQD